MDSKKKNMREAFSLIELVIAIAILTIFVGVVSLSVSLLRSSDTRGLANGVNGALTDLKAYTQSYHGPYYMFIYKNNKGYYAHFDSSPTFDVPTEEPADGDEKLGAADLVLKTDTGELASGDKVMLKIQKKDGAYASAPKYFEVYESEEETDPEYKVILAKNTGLHYIE